MTRDIVLFIPRAGEQKLGLLIGGNSFWKATFKPNPSDRSRGRVEASSRNTEICRKQSVFITLDFFDNRVLSFFGIYEIIFRNDRINDSHSGVALVSKCGANLSVEALSLQSKYDFCACVMVHLPDNGLFLFIVFIYHPIVVAIKIGPSTLNFCLSYCYLKSQLNNAELHVVYWVTLI